MTPSVVEVKQLIADLKADLMSRGEGSDLFRIERDDGLAAILGNLNQSVFGEPHNLPLSAKLHICYILSLKTTLFQMVTSAQGRFCLSTSLITIKH